jgi:[glutamine synthetase] adenylyltransferase / [glutamine synthetase]-adenylyl-L-tyrosine phosphorylase
MGQALAELMRPCGPVVDAAAVARLTEATGPLPAAVEPIAGASPYLASLMRRDPDRVARLLAAEPEAALADLLVRTTQAAELPDVDAAKPVLRRLKAELHLLTALCDLGGLWDLDQVTSALARFADASVAAALTVAVREEAAKGRMAAPMPGPAGPAPGLFCLALGKHGAFELNYSSDIDVSVFYAPERLPVADGVEPEKTALRLTRTLADLLQARTEDGYVFRVDLRLRPDPSSTPAAMPVAAALDYYESVGQNWERAAMIKARVCAGDQDEGAAFLKALVPFIWRRNLDYAAIADIHSIKRQIHAYKTDERLDAPGVNLKLGRGGIREIEFFVQTQQLILGGRKPELRSPRTLDALAALCAAGHVESTAADELRRAYIDLRGWEHRVQMLHDEQTHILPEDDDERRRVAALSGVADLAAFDDDVSSTLRRVNARYAELFSEDEPLSTPFGSLVFTGVDDDPETLATLARMGFSQPAQVSGTIRGWHHGRIAATRTARGRELFTRLAPRLLEAASAAGASDAAFTRFAAFFSGLSSGVQIQSLFLAQPELFHLVVEVMAFAPRLATTLARRPAALDALLDGHFFEPLRAEEEKAAFEPISELDEFEAAMNAARRIQRERLFRIGVQIMSGETNAAEAGRAFTALADGCIDALAPAAWRETERLAGAFQGEAAVIALGKAGSREMTAGSDLDLMTLYDAPADAASERKGWSPATVFARFTQRLVAALSSPTAEGMLYEVDMRLRPSGTAGPVAVALPAFQSYYAGEADTWEFMALTRARVVWASSPAFEKTCQGAIEAALRQPRDPAKTARDALAMRDLMRRERPAQGFWDLKLSDGGLVDIEFAAQTLQLAAAPHGGALNVSTLDALEAARRAGGLDEARHDDLAKTFVALQNLSQVMKIALDDADDPDAEPARLQGLMATAAGANDFDDLKRKLTEGRAAAHAGFLGLLEALASADGLSAG